jgi:hypothetical protein
LENRSFLGIYNLACRGWDKVQGFLYDLKNKFFYL